MQSDLIWMALGVRQLDLAAAHNGGSRSLPGCRAAAWIGTWTASGFAAGLIVRFTLRNPSGMLSGAAAGLIIGFGLWFIVALVQGLAVIVDPAEAAGPPDLLRSDRETGLRQGLITGVFGAALIVAVLWQQFDYSYHLVSGGLFWVLAWVLASLAATGMWILPGMVWGPWLIARPWLALRRRLPWDVMAFLDDAHRRGNSPPSRWRLPIPPRQAPALSRHRTTEPVARNRPHEVGKHHDSLITMRDQKIN
jgi:hypothetical protein